MPIAARIAAYLAVGLGAFVVPIQFSDAHHATAARAIAAEGTGPRAVLEVRQKVSVIRDGPVVDAELARYRSPEGGTASVALHGYDESAVVAQREGWFTVPGSSKDSVYVSNDGRFGMLAADYQGAIDGEFNAFYRIADAWIAGWAAIGVGALIVRAWSQVHRGAATVWRAGLAPTLYLAGAGVLVAISYGVSFPMARGS